MPQMDDPWGSRNTENFIIFMQMHMVVSEKLPSWEKIWNKLQKSSSSIAFMKSLHHNLEPKFTKLQVKFIKKWKTILTKVNETSKVSMTHLSA